MEFLTLFPNFPFPDIFKGIKREHWGEKGLQLQGFHLLTYEICVKPTFPLK